MTRLALLRHGPTSWNRENRIQGRTDVPLDARAREQLARLSLPARWETASLWSSPLARARDTAELVTGRAPRTSPALVEMDWGDWEGRHGAELRADPKSGYRDIEHWGWDYRPPNGESPAEIRARLSPWMAALTGDNIAVCHIGVMRVLLAISWGWDFEGSCPFAIKRNRLFVLETRGAAWHPLPEPQRLIEDPA